MCAPRVWHSKFLVLYLVVVVAAAVVVVVVIDDIVVFVIRISVPTVRSAPQHITQSRLSVNLFIYLFVVIVIIIEAIIFVISYEYMVFFFRRLSISVRRVIALLNDSNCIESPAFCVRLLVGRCSKFEMINVEIANSYSNTAQNQAENRNHSEQINTRRRTVDEHVLQCHSRHQITFNPTSINMILFLFLN